MLPSGTDLTYFVEIAQVENFSRASERLGVSQPTLSLAMKRLEENIGAQLFVRTKSGVHLTPCGRSLLAKARFLMQEWERTREQSVEAQDEVRGEIRLGCHVSVALYSLSLFLPKLLKQHPQLEVKLVHDLSRHIMESVISLKLDLGVVINPVRHPDLVCKKLCDDEVTLWKLRGQKEVPSVLICDPELLQTQDLQKRLKKTKLNFLRTLSSSSLEVISDLTSSGVGVGILPSRLVQKLAPKLERVAEAPSFKDELYLIYRVENRRVRAIEVIGQELEKVFL